MTIHAKSGQANGNVGRGGDGGTGGREYVLGTGDDELVRLEIQHRLWSDMAVSSWRRAGISLGCRVLDLGSGPGHATFDLAQMVTHSGLVIAADQSQSFVDHIRKSAKDRGMTHVRAEVSNAEALSLEVMSAAPFDAVYVRWLLCFLPDPSAVLRAAKSVLKPGGRIIIHDYFNWQSMTAAPRVPGLDRFIRASMASWSARGGNPDVVAALPRSWHECGFELTHLEMHARLARCGMSAGSGPNDVWNDPLMAWPMTWWRTYAPKLVQMGQLTQAECDQGLQELAVMERDPFAFVVCPPVYELIARV